MKGRLISVVVPVYNRASILNETLQSVRAQTYRPIELIIVDNGSTDASLFVSRDFADTMLGCGLQAVSGSLFLIRMT